MHDLKQIKKNNKETRKRFPPVSPTELARAYKAVHGEEIAKSR